ncbi:MAG: hypothetical protein ACI857_000961 [Arenicella sp.]
MQNLFRYTSCFICLLFALNTNAQVKVFEPEGSISVDIGIPAQGQNESFKRVMNGLFNGGINYQYNIFKGLTLGVGVKYSFMIINSFALNNAEWGGSLHMPSAYGKIGYERFITERFSISVGARMGYTYLLSSNDSCKAELGKPYQESTFFVEPQIELLLLTDKNSAGGFSFVLGYNMVFSEFGPHYLCLDKIPNLFEEDYQGITRFLSVGFGYRHYMGRK